MAIIPVAINGSQCGGTVQATGVKLLVQGQPVALVGDNVTAHGDHEHQHLSAGTPKLSIGGVAVCIVTSPCSCGHSVTTGSLALRVGV